MPFIGKPAEFKSRVAIHKGIEDSGMKLLSFKGGPPTFIEDVLLLDLPGLVWGNRGQISVIPLPEVPPFVDVKKDGRVVAHFLDNHLNGDYPLPEFFHKGRQDMLYQGAAGGATGIRGLLLLKGVGGMVCCQDIDATVQNSLP